jgi:hypothetical protein
MLEAFKNLFNGTAFLPDPRDSSYPIRQRLRNQNFIVACLTDQGMLAQVARFDRKGNLQPRRLERSPEQASDEGKIRFLADIARRSDVTNLVLLVDNGWFASLVDNAFRGSRLEWERLLREEPRQIIISNPADGIRYASLNHPTMNRAVVFAFRRDILKAAEEMAGSAGLSLVRLQSGCYALLSSLVELAPEKAQNCDLLIADQGSLLLLIEEKGDWVDVGSRGDLTDQTVARALHDLLERRPNPGKPLAWVGPGVMGDRSTLTEVVDGACELREIDNLSTQSTELPLEFRAVLQN